MKVLSKKKLIRQAGFPRESGGPGGPCPGVQGLDEAEKVPPNRVPCRVPWADAPETARGPLTEGFLTHVHEQKYLLM